VNNITIVSRQRLMSAAVPSKHAVVTVLVRVVLQHQQLLNETRRAIETRRIACTTVCASTWTTLHAFEMSHHHHINLLLLVAELLLSTQMAEAARNANQQRIPLVQLQVQVV
jgi:hypothetical protein